MPICSYAPGRNVNFSGIVYAKGKKMVALTLTNRIPRKHIIDFQQLEFNQQQLRGDIS